MMDGAIVLDTTAKTLEGFLDAAGTDVIFTVSWRDELSNSTTQPSRASGTETASNGATDVTICAAPPANVTRNITMVRAYNGNSATRVVTIQINNGADRIQWKQSLLTTETFEWNIKSGPSVI